jgi:hypothetical protein
MQIAKWSDPPPPALSDSIGEQLHHSTPDPAALSVKSYYGGRNTSIIGQLQKMFQVAKRQVNLSFLLFELWNAKRNKETWSQSSEGNPVPLLRLACHHVSLKSYENCFELFLYCCCCSHSERGAREKE